LGAVAAALTFGFFVISQLLSGVTDEVLFKERNFYGTLRVERKEMLENEAKESMHTLTHGTTLHGVQSLNEAVRLKPISYYRALEAFFAEAHARLPSSARMAVIGLGSGSLACYGRAGDVVDFFEIDPAVIRVANDPRYFTFLSECPPKNNMILGDARLSLEKQEDGKYDIMVLDAYSSDAIPFHLITREAIELYRRKLKKDGVLLFHISNRYFDLIPVLEPIFRQWDVQGWVRRDFKPKRKYAVPSIWMMFSESKALTAAIAEKDPLWKKNTVSGENIWSDEYYNVLSILK
jgi:SAM-dependent methyltransferase